MFHVYQHIDRIAQKPKTQDGPLVHDGDAMVIPASHTRARLRFETTSDRTTLAHGQVITVGPGVRVLQYLSATERPVMELAEVVPAVVEAA